MPIPTPSAGQTEEEYIGACISEISSEYDVEGQAYAVCKAKYDEGNMSQQISFEEMKKAIKAMKAFTS